MARLFVAIAFLTRLPVPRRFLGDGNDAGAFDVGRASACFPLVGALVGGLEALVLIAAARALPPLVAAALTVAAGAVITGGLHLDGLADTADGAGGRSAADALRIMRDHRIGAYGAIALGLTLLVKVSALAALAGAAPRAIAATLAVAAALGRALPVALAAALPYARRDGGLGAALRPGRVEVAAATLSALALALGLGGLRGAVTAAAVALFGLACAAWCRRRLGGFTGDTLGAAVELAEALAYLIAIAR